MTRKSRATPRPPPLCRLEVDPDVAVAAFRFASHSAPGRTYDAALLVGEDCGESVTYWDCTCWPFLKVDACDHVDYARFELRADERQESLDARLGCRHPLTFDEWELDYAEQRTHLVRTCMGCGLVADRTNWLDQIEAACLRRWSLSGIESPWSAGERASDTE